ncbi:MAG: zf-HC2 domain-containing protein [Proteobacteria bacterium]|nr:zf-HC2 domain-containing protein [Pseudomonadota bacterium]
MTCTRLTEKLDDYVDGLMDRAESAALGAHIETCNDCHQVLARAQGLRESLRAYGRSSMPHPDAAFFDRALAQAARTGIRRQRSRWVMTAAGAAIAAGLVLWMLGGMFLKTPEIAQPHPVIVMTLEEPRTLNLVFSSATALANATMTVVLPQGVELMGFTGQRQITWITSLTSGKNILPLTLIATSPQGGELMATLRHEGDERTFRIQVNIIS